ncbi:MAG: hypothetical protein WDZ49_17400 [Litorilinea sp.]
MIIKSFDSLQALGEKFDSEVFKDITDGTFFVYDRVSNLWYRYRFAPGRQEINFLHSLRGEQLPIVTQVYPEI